MRKEKCIVIFLKLLKLHFFEITVSENKYRNPLKSI